MSMKRLTTNEPKDNLEADLNLFYIKGHETWVRGGGPGPEYSDVSLFDFIRDVAKAYFPDVELPENDEDVSLAMPEWIMDGIDSPEGVLALLYTAAWAYAELRHKLMKYEDTGLEPDVCAEYRKFEDEAVGKGVPFKRIVELMNAEQDGRLVALPCKVGDTVYWIHNGIITDCRVHRVQMNRTGLFICLKSKVSHGAFRIDSVGRTIFLNRDEAEAALAGEDGALSDAPPEEPAEPEWKRKMMQTFLGGR